MPEKQSHKLSDQYSGNIYQVTFFVSILVLLCLIVFRLLLIFTYNAEIGGIDNNFVYAVIRGMAGFDIYPDPARVPYAVNPYSPLYFNLCSLIGNIFNINIEEPINVYRLCRSVSFFCDVLTSIIFFRLLQKGTSLKKEISLFITAVFVCILCYLGYTFSRADSLFLLFYALIFYILLQRTNKINKTTLLVLAVLTTACIFSKQNGIILPVLLFIWLFMNGSLKKSLIYLGLFVLLFTGTMLFYKSFLGYTHFTSHTIEALRNRIDLSWFYVYIFKRLADSLLLLPVYFAVCISVVHLKKGSAKEKSLSIIFLIQTVFSLGTSLKWGSSAGYFNESIFLSLFITGHYLSTFEIFRQTIYQGKLLAWLLPLFVLFCIHVCVQGYLFFIQNQNEKKNIYNEQSAIRTYLRPRLKGNYVLNLGNQNGDFFKTLFYKEAVVPNYDMVSCCSLPDNIFDYSALLNDLQNGKIGYLLMPEKETITEIWGLPLQQFKKDTSLNGHAIYKYQKQ
jgi:hypothetical protein